MPLNDVVLCSGKEQSTEQENSYMKHARSQIEFL